MKSPEIRSLAVIGAGAWGTALALAADRAGLKVTLWAREDALRAALADQRENTVFLPGVPVPARIAIATELSKAAAADLVLLAAPAQHVRSMLETLRPLLAPGQDVLLAAKGIEQSTGLMMSEVARAAAPQVRLGILSGPSFARDVALGLPTAVTLAGENLSHAEMLCAALQSPALRLYASDDLTGVALGGAAKNVLAIACGIAEGRGLGDSARAALITRGFAELTRLGRALGARAETLMGLAGLGDLVLTASSRQSRNFSYGLELGAKGDAAAAAHAAKGVVEGALSAAPLLRRAAALNVDMPICETVDALISGRRDLDTAIKALLSRPQKAETG